MSEDYFDARVDTFIATTRMKSKDTKVFGRTEKEKEQRRELLIEASRKNKKLTI